jgi:hypothetical protein
MNSVVGQSLVELLLAGGVPSHEEAAQLAANSNGGSWMTQVLDSGKVDENRFLHALGNHFHVPVTSVDAKAIDRQTLSLLPSRVVFQHHILPIEAKENSVVIATYDLFNTVARQLALQLLKKPAEWVLVPRGQILAAMKSLYGVGAETFDEILKSNRSYEADQDIEGATDLNADDPEASVVKFVNQIIREAIVERATDIHVEPLETICAFAIASTASCTKSRCRRSCACCNRRSSRASRSWRTWTSLSAVCRRMVASTCNRTREHRRRVLDDPDGERRVDQLALAEPRSAASAVRLRAAGFESGAREDRAGIAGAAERHCARDRPDRFGEINVALLVPQQHQLGRAAYHHDRGAGGISVARRVADRRETGDRPDVRERPAPHSATGPECDHGR